MIRGRHLVRAATPLIRTQPHVRNVNLFAEFAKSIKKQVKENKEFQENVKMLTDETSRLGEADAVQRAKKAMEKSAESTSKVVKTIKKGVNVVGDAVEKTMETEAVKKTVETVEKITDKTAETLEKAAEPILETKVAKTIKKDIFKSGLTARYSEYKPKEVREKEKEEMEKDLLLENPLSGAKRISGPVNPNPDAGSEVVMHQTSKWESGWDNFKKKNPLLKGFSNVQKSVEESDNPLVERIRDFFSSVSEETEQAQVIRLFKATDPSFTLERFLKKATEEYIPEIMEAYLAGDMEALKQWCSEPLIAQFSAGYSAQKSQGLISHCKLLDIRKFDIVSTKVMENDIPIVIVDFNTQELLLFKNAKGEVVLGKEDHIEHVRYRAVFTKDQCLDPTIPFNKVTNGYRCQECVRIDSWSSV